MSQATSPRSVGDGPDAPDPDVEARVARDPDGEDTGPHEPEPVDHGGLDRLARRILGLRDAEPRALDTTATAPRPPGPEHPKNSRRSPAQTDVAPKIFDVAQGAATRIAKPCHLPVPALRLAPWT